MAAAMHPQELIAEVASLRKRGKRLAHGGAWLPAAVLAAIPLASAALYRPGGGAAGATAGAGAGELITVPFWAGLPAAQRSSVASYVFWILAEPLALAVVAAWYRHREARNGVRVAWWAPVAAGAAGLLTLLLLAAAPGDQGAGSAALGLSPWHGLFTPLLTLGLAACALGFIERSASLTLAAVWFCWLAWQFCSTGTVGGILGWQDWLLSGKSGPALGGQLTIFWLDRPGPALCVMSLPLLLCAVVRGLAALRNRQRHVVAP